LRTIRRVAIAALVLLITVSAAAAQQSVVASIRAKYPTPLGEQHARFLVEVAQATGAQLFEKPSGDHVFVPQIGKFVSLDVIGRGRLGDVWVDILGDAEGAAVPTWDAHAGAAGTYLDVSGIALDPTTPPPPPPPPGADLAAIAVRLDRLESTLKDIQQLQATDHGVIWGLGAFASDARDRLARIEALASRPIELPPLSFPVYAGKVLGQTVTLRPQR
jgi:hypothetical protein